MSEQNRYTIHCPKCRHQQEVELYESINVQSSPDLKEKLMANQVNLVVCGQCGLSFRVDKALLYHDPARRVMIYLIPLGEAVFEAGEQEFADLLRRLNGVLPEGLQAPEVCLVFSRVELIERIFLFDAGLNERVIEYIKYMIYTRNLAKVTPAEKALLFDAQDSTPENLRFVVQDVKTRKLEAVLDYERKAYTALCEMFDRDSQTPTLLELFPGPHVSARALLLREARTPPAEGRLSAGEKKKPAGSS